MSKKFFLHVKKLDALISRESTGSPAELAIKMRVSVRCVYNYIWLMREQGAPIIYNRKKKSFSYIEPGHFYFEFVKSDN
jgi:hypothetical protein